MDPFLVFLLSVVVITMSGALSPGPLLFTNLSNAHRWGWKGGIWLSIGHTFVEFPIILLIAFGLSFFIYNSFLQLIIAALGGIVLLSFGLYQIYDGLTPIEQQIQTDLAADKPSRHPFIIGLIFSAFNPFFVVWWFTVGAKIVIDALLLAALGGVIIMFFAHVWMDYVWLAGTAWLANKGSRIIGTKGYTILTLVFGCALIFFGLIYCWNAIIIAGLL